MTAAHEDLNELRAMLVDEIGRLAETLLGPPTRGSKAKPRWGNNGSLEVIVSGRKKGSWVSREGGGGGPFELIMREQACGFRDAVIWARAWTNSGGARRPKPLAIKPTQCDSEEQAERARAINAARTMAYAASPIAGTAGEAYLTGPRGIPAPVAGWPDAIRFHPPTQSLLAVATTHDSAVQAVQRVHLTGAGQKAEATPERPVKVTNGRQEGALVRLPERLDVAPALRSVLLLAEGPENGLSVWAATGAETWLVFGVGMFPRADIPADRRTILCRDDDRQHSAADKAVRKAVSGWRTSGRDVVVATPWEDRRQDKSDFNDVMQASGSAGVLARILPHSPAPPKPPTKRVPVAVARSQVDSAVQAFFSVAAAFDSEMAKAEGIAPPVHAARVSVGVGKSHAARHHAVKLLVALRRRGDKRNVALAVPTHRLGAEQAAMLQALPAVQAANLTVAVWRGRTAADPEHSDFANTNVPDDEKTAMCRNLADVFDAQSHGLRVDETACRRSVKSGDGERVVYECPLFAECAYQAQRKRRADLWLVAHEMLFTSKPKALEDLAAVVVDESPWQASLEGVTGRGERMSLDAFKGDDSKFGDSRSPDWLVLQHHRSRALDALMGLTTGAIPRDVMAAEGLTAKDAAEAHALEFNRLAKPQIYPGMPRKERIDLLKTAEGNKVIMQRARLWRALEALLEADGPAASGWAERATVETPDGPCEVVRLRGRKPVRKGWLVPTLLIDALLNTNLVRPLWPQVELVADVQAETRHQRIRQVIDRSYSKSRLVPLDEDKAKADPEEARRRIRNLREARAVLFRVARQHRGGRVLAVAQKEVREAIEALGPLPRNLVLGHHNAVAGRDEWGDVAAIVVLGRTAPPPQDVERICEALTGAAVTPLGGWYPRTPASREMADGEAMAAETDIHPDAMCEAIRWHITEGELVQIIGRGRGVNRTEATPLEVLVMTDAPLPVPVDEAIGFAHLAPSTDDRMLAECGIAFETPRHAAAACPALWAKWETAKSALAKGKKGEIPYKYILIGDFTLLPPELRRVDYRRSGQGQGDAVAWFDPLIVADVERALTRLLGPLAWCSVACDPPSQAHLTVVPPAPAIPADGEERAVPEILPPAIPGLFLPMPQPRQAPRLLLFPGRPIILARPAAVRPTPTAPPA